MFIDKFSSLLFLTVVLLIYERGADCLTISSRLNNFRTPYTRRESFPAFASNPVYQLQRKIYRAYEEKQKSKIEENKKTKNNNEKVTVITPIYSSTISNIDKVSDKVNLNNISHSTIITDTNTIGYFKNTSKIDKINSAEIDKNNNISTTPHYFQNTSEIDNVSNNKIDINNDSIITTPRNLQTTPKTDNVSESKLDIDNDSIITTPRYFQYSPDIDNVSDGDIEYEENITTPKNESENAGITKINDTNYRVLVRLRGSSETYSNIKRGLSVTDDYQPIDNKDFSVGDETQVYFDGNLPHQENCTDEDKLMNEDDDGLPTESEKKNNEDLNGKVNKSPIDQSSNPISEIKLDSHKINQQSNDREGHSDVVQSIKSHEVHKDDIKLTEDQYDYFNPHLTGVSNGNFDPHLTGVSDGNSYRSNDDIFSNNNRYGNDNRYNSYTDAMKFYSDRIRTQNSETPSQATRPKRPNEVSGLAKHQHDETNQKYLLNNDRNDEVISHSSKFAQLTETQDNYPVISKSYGGQTIYPTSDKSSGHENPSLYAPSSSGNDNFTRVNQNSDFTAYSFDDDNQDDFQFGSNPKYSDGSVVSEDETRNINENIGRFNYAQGERNTGDASLGIIATLLDKFTMFQLSMKNTMQALIDRISAVEGSLAYRRDENTYPLSSQYRESPPTNNIFGDKQDIYNYVRQESFDNELKPISNSLQHKDDRHSYNIFPPKVHDTKTLQTNPDDTYVKYSLPEESFMGDSDESLKIYQPEELPPQANCVGPNCKGKQINPYVTILDEPPIEETKNIHHYSKFQKPYVNEPQNKRPFSDFQDPNSDETQNSRPFHGSKAGEKHDDNLIANDKEKDMTKYNNHAEESNTKDNFKKFNEQPSMDYSSFPFNDPDPVNPNCRDEDGIDCGQADDDDSEYLRRLDTLTKMDKFQARIFTDGYDGVFNRELTDIEHIEKKLDHLKAKVALQAELEEILKHIKPTEPSCPYNIPSLRIGYRCFSLELSHLSFDDAQKFCSKRGGTLAQEPLDVFLWAQITKAYPQYITKEMWIGASDRDYEEGTFAFTNGDIVSSSDPRWQQHSPSLSKFNKRDCLALDSKSVIVFKDLPCTNKLHFICEFPLSSIIDIH